MFKKNPIEAKLDEEIVALLDKMKDQDKTSQEYGTLVDQFNKLHELRHKSKVSKETLATIASNILGIVVILNHERVHVIASKAFSLVKKIG